MKKKTGILGNAKDSEESLIDPKSEEEKKNKKAGDLAEKPDVDPGIDYMRWSD